MAIEDPLEKYRRKVPDAPAKPASAPGIDYQAFAVEAHAQRRLRIECASGPNHTPSYSYLVDVIDNGPAFTRVGLVFSHQVYQFEGKYLHELVMLLQEEKVKRVVEFNPEVWDAPEDGQAVISKVQVFERAEAALGHTKPDDKAPAP